MYVPFPPQHLNINNTHSILNLQLPLAQPIFLVILRNQRLHIPNALSIFINTSITTEEAHSRNTQDSLGDPLILVLVRLIDQSLRLDVTVEIIRDKVIVAMVFDSANEGSERTGVAKGVGFDTFEDLGEVGVESVRAVGMGVAEVFDVFRKVAEEEDVVFADFAGDFNLVFLLVGPKTYIEGKDLR